MICIFHLQQCVVPMHGWLTQLAIPPSPECFFLMRPRLPSVFLPLVVILETDKNSACIYDCDSTRAVHIQACTVCIQCSPVWLECWHDFSATSVGKISLYLNFGYTRKEGINFVLLDMWRTSNVLKHTYLLNIDSALPFVKFLEHGSWDKPFSTIVSAQYNVALSLQWTN